MRSASVDIRGGACPHIRPVDDKILPPLMFETADARQIDGLVEGMKDGH